MLDRLKTAFSSEGFEDIGDVDDPIAEGQPKVEALSLAKKRADEAREFIEKTTPKLKRLKERNDKLELLLPFEKLEVLKLQVQILQAGRQIIYNNFAYADYSQDKKEKDIIAEKSKKIVEKIDEKKKEFYEIRAEAQKIKRIYSFPYPLNRDPRVRYYKEFYSDPFRTDENILRAPAFKHFPIDEKAQQRALNNKGFRYSKEKIKEMHKAVEELRAELIDSEKFIDDADNLFEEIGL